jgi:hemerythrin
MPIPWTSELSVGVKEIDEQHQVFLGILNDLCDVMCHCDSDSEIASILRQLSAYTSFHFCH